jgi:hypothetical protein
MKSLFIVLALTSIILLSGVAICSGRISEEGLEEYIRKYLHEYRILFDTYVADLGNLSEFKFYSGYPYNVKGIISKIHGAAIFFHSSTKEEIEIQMIEERIEFYLWPVMKDNPQTTFWEIENDEESGGFTSYYITANLQIGDGVTPTFFHHRRNEIVIFASSEIPFDYRIIVKPLGYLKVDGILIYENRMILKGSNNEQDWLPEIALLDATNEFLRLARRAALDEAKIKQIEGFSLLKAKVEEIERNLASGAYEDNWRLRWKDEEEFWQIVKKYGIKEELAQRILDEILEPYLKQESEPNLILEIAKWTVVLIIAPVAAGLIIARITGKWKPKFFSSRRRKLKKPPSRTQRKKCLSLL